MSIQISCTIKIVPACIIYTFFRFVQQQWCNQRRKKTNRDSCGLKIDLHPRERSGCNLCCVWIIGFHHIHTNPYPFKTLVPVQDFKEKIQKYPCIFKRSWQQTINYLLESYFNKYAFHFIYTTYYNIHVINEPIVVTTRRLE